MSRSMEVLPTFIVVGAAKSGTTALYHWFDQHPGVYMSSVKEPHFFSGLKPTYSGPGDDRFNQPIVTEWQDYLDLFSAGSQFAVRGEASPSYLDLYQPAIQRMREAVPGVKIVILLRHPTRRAFSEYVHLVRDGRESLSFRESLDAEEERLAKGWRRIWAHKRRGLYADAVEAYLSAFGRENVGVWLFENLKNHPETTFRQICQFVGASDEFAPFFSQVNVGGVPRLRWLHRWLNRQSGFLTWMRRRLPAGWRSRLRQSVDHLNLGKISMSEDDRAYLDEYYRGDIERLRQLLPDVDFSPWTRQKMGEPSPALGSRSAPARL